MNRALPGLVPADLAARAALLSLAVNFALMILKLAVGLVTNSVAVLSDGVDSAQDVVASGVVLLSVRVGSRPPDLTHPYGHGRVETLAAGLQALLISGAALYILSRAAGRLLDPPDSIDTDLALIAMTVAALANYAVVLYSRRAARETGSPAIAADASHLMTNVVQALAILIGLALVAVTGEKAFDALVALGLVAYLLWTAATILRSVVMDLLDASLDEGEVAFIEQAILVERPEIDGYHRLRTRRSGRQRAIDLHLLFPPETSLRAAHAVTERIEQRIKARWPNAAVLIHMEPSDGRFRGPFQAGAGSRGREGEHPPDEE